VVIQPYQNLLIDSLDAILAVNDISLNLYFKTIEPLEFMDLENVEGEEAIEEQTGIKEEDQTTDIELMASKSVSNKDNDKLLKKALESLKGIKMDSEEFEMVDIRDLNDENESVEDWASSMIKLSDVIDSKEDGFSTLDKSMYKVRYKYAKGSTRTGGESRGFCKEMMSRTSSGIVYRLEDIDKASRSMDFAAAELPMHNGEKYDLFKFKGGVYCRHKWQQVLYKIKKGKEVGSDDLDDYKKTKSIPKSYEPKPRGRKESVKAPVNMPNNGHHPNYKK